MTFTKTRICTAVGALLFAVSTTALPQQGSTERGATSGDRSTTTQRDTSRAKESDRAASRSAKKDDSKVSRADRRMMETIARKNMGEVELSKIAQQNATNAQVKQYAEKMVKDHGQAGDDLKQVAAQDNVTLPAEMDRSHKRAADNLAKAKGADFDRRYMSRMVDDHESTLKDLRKAAKDAKDPELKAFAEKTAQHVEEHLKEARQIASAVGAKGGDRSASRDDKRTSSTGATAPRNRDDATNRSKAGSTASGGSSSGPTQGRAPATSGNGDSSGNK